MVKKILSIAAIAIAAIVPFYVPSTKSNDIKTSSIEITSVIPEPATWGDSWTSEKNNPYYIPTKQDFIDLFCAVYERQMASEISSQSGHSLDSRAYSAFGLNNTKDYFYYRYFKISPLDASLPVSNHNFVDEWPDPFWNGGKYVFLELLYYLEGYLVPFFINTEYDGGVVAYLNSNLDEVDTDNIPDNYIYRRCSDWGEVFYDYDAPIKGYYLPFYSCHSLYSSLGYSYSKFSSIYYNLGPTPDGHVFSVRKKHSGIECYESNRIDLFSFNYYGETNNYNTNWLYSDDSINIDNWIYVRPWGSTYPWHYIIQPPINIMNYNGFSIISDSSNSVSATFAFNCLDLNSPITNIYYPIENRDYMISYRATNYTVSGSLPITLPPNIFPLLLITNQCDISKGLLGQNIKGSFLGSNLFGDQDLYFPNGDSDSSRPFPSSWNADSYDYAEGHHTMNPDLWPAMLKMKEALSKLKSVQVPAEILPKTIYSYYRLTGSPTEFTSTPVSGWPTNIIPYVNNGNSYFPYEKFIADVYSTIGNSITKSDGDATEYSGFQIPFLYDGLFSERTSYEIQDLFSKINSINICVANTYDPDVNYYGNTFTPTREPKVTYMEFDSSASFSSEIKASSFYLYEQNMESSTNYWVISEQPLGLDGGAWLQSNPLGTIRGVYGDYTYYNDAAYFSAVTYITFNFNFD